MEELNKEQKLLLSISLGDGYISRNHGYHISITHCEKQLDYLNYKKKLLENTQSFKTSTRKKCSIEIKPFLTELNNKTFKQFRYTLTRANLIKPVYNLLIINGKKKITTKVLDNLDENSLFFIMCDDGCCIKNKKKRINKKGEEYLYIEPPTFRICFHSFSKKENELFLKWLKEKYGIEGRLNKNKGYYIPHFNSTNSKLIWNIIKEKVATIPSMVEKFNFCIEKFGL